MLEISVSLLSVKKEDLIPTLFYNLETAKIDYFHIDVADGKFVEKNNLEVMKECSLTLSHISNVGLDVHLMVENVEEIMDDYIPLEPKIITFHYEAIRDKERMMNIIEDIKDNGIQVGIAISPETKVQEIQEFLPYIHQVLIMTVVPGKGGQKFIPEMVEKIKELRKIISDNNLENLVIEVDGGINCETVKHVKSAGCDRVVSGSYITNSENYAESVKKLKED